jgi:hypothetical protein
MKISYPVPWSLLVRIVLASITGQNLSFRKEATAWINKLRPPLEIHGTEHLPVEGGFVILVNHYYRPRFHAWWIALAIASEIPREMHWIMTNAWTFPGKSWGRFLEKISNFLFRHVARVFTFSTMPPMPPRPHEVAERALAVRKVLRLVHNHPGIILGLAPEGGDNLDGKLHLPPAGAGRFINHLQERGLKLIPAGIFETDRLHLCFGAPIRVESYNFKTPDELDRAYCTQIFFSIAALLPQEHIAFPSP